MDTYQSHEQRLYCKPHFKELFQPKAVLDDDESGTVVADERNDGDSQQQQQQHGPTGKSVLSSTTQHNRSKLQLIICESQPKELPPDVVRGGCQPHFGLPIHIHYASQTICIRMVRRPSECLSLVLVHFCLTFFFLSHHLHLPPPCCCAI